jgi:hypothetical protein
MKSAGEGKRFNAFLAEFTDAWLLAGAAAGGIPDIPAAIFNCALRRCRPIETAGAGIYEGAQSSQVTLLRQNGSKPSS